MHLPVPAPAPAEVPTENLAAEPDASNAILLAKDGKYTIPYEILMQVRESELISKENANRFTEIAGGQEVGSTTQQLTTRPARVLNIRTGQFIGQPASQRAAMPRCRDAASMTREVGTLGANRFTRTRRGSALWEACGTQPRSLLAKHGAICYNRSVGSLQEHLVRAWSVFGLHTTGSDVADIVDSRGWEKSQELRTTGNGS